MGPRRRNTSRIHQNKYGYLGCRLGALRLRDLHRVRSAGTAQCVLRWWLRRMRQRAVAPMDIQIRLVKAHAHPPQRYEQRNAPTYPFADHPEEISARHAAGQTLHSRLREISGQNKRVLATMKALNSPSHGSGEKYRFRRRRSRRQFVRSR